MRDLIQRIEKAEAGSRELSHEIILALRPFNDESGFHAAYDADPQAARWWAWGKKDVTESLDDARALADRVLPGVRIVIDSACKETGNPAAGFVFSQTDDGRIDGVMHDGKTLPLALVAAILQARLREEGRS